MMLEYLAGEGGLALLDMNPGLVIWTFIVFGIVLFLLSRFAWKPIASALDERANQIHADIQKASDLKDDAERKLAEYMQKLDSLKEEGHAIINEAQEDARKLKDQMLAEARTEADAIKGRALREVGLARDEALRSIHDTVAEVATAVAARILDKNLKASDHADLVQDTLKNINSLN
ncbi:MAG: F0F1 ATP synthase subunit B [Leptospiraceae bacterium]|nr:F0F1 ATP synthase subunit B [Leptospiraceae bacterium]